MKFEWDPRKATGNLRKHGVSFDEAMTVFADWESITIPDPDHSEEEERFIIVGVSSRGRILFVVSRRFQMPKFITIGYGDREGYDRTPKAVRDAAHAHDEVLQKNGVLMGIAGPPVQVRNHEAKKVQTEDGPFMAAKLPVAGFAVIEAPSMADAIKMVSKTPCSVAYGVVEVWPLEQPSGAA